MAVASFELEVTTPEKLVIQATCTEAQIPGSEGELGILPGHAPLLSTLASMGADSLTLLQRAQAEVNGGCSILRSFPRKRESRPF